MGFVAETTVVIPWAPTSCSTPTSRCSGRRLPFQGAKGHEGQASSIIPSLGGPPSLLIGELGSEPDLSAGHQK